MFNKGLDSNERQEGLLKRFKNIEDKTDNLNNSKNNTSDLKKIDFYDINNPEARKLVSSINDTVSFIEGVDNKKLGEPKFSLVNSKGEAIADLAKHTRIINFGTSIRDGGRTIEEAENYLNDMEKDMMDIRSASVKKERKEIINYK